MPTKKRHPIVAFICSLFCPGLGQLYVGNLRLAALYPSIMIGLLILVVLTAQTHFWPYLILFTAILANILAASTQAFISAKRAGMVKLQKFQKVYIYVIFYFAFAALLNVIMIATPRALAIPSASMAPTIMPEEKIMSDFFMYSRHAPEAGDVIVFTSPDESAIYVKRIIGLPGDKIKGDQDCTIYRNGVAIEKKALSELNIQGRLEKAFEEKIGNKVYTVVHAGTPCEPFETPEIPANGYFVMGDNRENSQDSRVTGPVFGENILGRASFIYWGRIGTEIR